LLFGGCNKNEFYNDLYYYSLESGKWSKPAVGGMGPDPRCYHTCTVIGKEMFIFGGMGKVKIFSDVYVFNLENDSWTKVMLPGMPKPRFGHTATAIGTSILMLGGRTMPSAINEAAVAEGGSGDLIDSFVGGIPVLDTANRGWVDNPIQLSIDEDVAHHSAVALSETKIIFLFGLKLTIQKNGRKLNPRLECVNNYRILYHLDSVNLQYNVQSTKKKSKMHMGRRKSQHFLARRDMIKRNSQYAGVNSGEDEKEKEKRNKATKVCIVSSREVNNNS
tara:strand:+ start:883 stop:1710 length:828 start_codon:yes stop_codon:yes gene_type:complete